MRVEPREDARGAGTPGVGSGWVDLHCHVLPAIDDGARDAGVALEMLRVEAADGVAVVVATPHAHRSDAAEIPAAVARLNQLAAEAGIGVTVLAGQEARIGAHLCERVRSGELLRINGTRYLLMELHLYGSWPTNTLAVVDELLEAGIRPILAHAERYEDVQRQPELVLPLIERGVPIQINADSLGERAERGARPAAEALLARHMAHLIASDSHSASWRPPGLDAAFCRAAEIAGPEHTEWMARAAWAVIRDEPLSLPPVRC